MFEQETHENKENQQLNLYTKDKLIVIRAGDFDPEKIPYTSYIVFPRRNWPNEMFPHDIAGVSNPVWRLEEQATQEWFLIDQFNEARRVSSDKYHKAIEYSSWADYDMIITKRKLEKLAKVKSITINVKTYLFSIMGITELNPKDKPQVLELCRKCLREIEKLE